MKEWATIPVAQNGEELGLWNVESEFETGGLKFSKDRHSPTCENCRGGKLLNFIHS
jgi:hypothetical protein